MIPDAKNALEKLMNKVEFGIFQTGGESYELVQILYDNHKKYYANL